MNDLYTFNLSDIQPEQYINCLLAKASLKESTKWHRWMAHVNFKTINKLAKNGVVEGLPLKHFTNEHNCVACNKGKQHKASYKAISAVRKISEPLKLLHMDLFGPTSIRSIDHKYYSLVITDDFSRFSWAFFLGTKDETFYILMDFIALIENQLNKKVKAIRCDNRKEFQNAKLITLCGEKEIKRDYSNSKTPQQNEVDERKNRTLIETARSMLADSKLPTMFWTEAVSTACYVLNRVSITNPHNKTPYELLSGKVPNIRHLKPFGCQVTILNTSDHLGKFEGKANEDFLVGYAANSTQDTNINAGTQDADSDSECDEQAILVPSFLSNSFSAEMLHQAELETHRNLVLAAGDPAGSIVSIGGVPAGSVPAGSVPASHVPASSVPARSVPASHVPASSVPACSVPASNVPAGGVLVGSINSTGFGDPAASESVLAVFTLDHAANSILPPASSVAVDPVATKRVNTIHPQSQIIGELTSPVQTRSTVQKSKFGERAYISYVHNQNKTNHTDHLHCFFACFLSQLEPSSMAKALEDPDWVAAMQEEMQQFYNQQNKRDAKGIVVRNKARLVAQGHRQEEGIDYDKGFEDPHNPKHVYRVVKALYGLHQAPRAWHIILVQVYVDDIIFDSTNKAWCDEFEVLMKREFEMSAMGKLTFFLGLQVKQLPDGIVISQDKYVKDMLKKFDMESVRTTTTAYEVPKPKSKDEPDDAVNVHLYRSMIGSLMYLTASRPDIMFAVSACSRHQVIPMTSHLNAVKKIFKYLKGKPNLGLWYPRDSPFQLEVYSDSNYAGPHWDVQSLGTGIEGRNKPKRRLTIVYFMYTYFCAGRPPMLLVVPVFLLVVLFSADGWVSAGSCTISTGSYSFMLLDWFLLAWPSEIIATIAGNEVVVTESLIRTQLQLNDENGLYEFTLHDVLDGMREIWIYNFSMFILDGMIGNIGSKRHKFLMYPRFLQMILGPVGEDGVDAVAAGAAAVNEVSPPPPPPNVPPTHTSSSSPGPSTAAQDTPVWNPTPVRELTPVREPTPSPVREPTPFWVPTPDSSRPPSPPPYPRSEEIGPTTLTRPPSPTRQTSFLKDISEGGGYYVSSPKSNEALPTTVAGGAEDSAALTDLSLKLDRCINRVTTLENELGVTKKVLGGVVLKLVSRVNRLEGLLQQRKRRLVLSNSEGEEAATKKQDINLDALHKLASTSLGGDTTVETAYTIYKASQDAHASSDAGHDADAGLDDTTMPFRRTRTKRRRLRKTYTSSAFEHFQSNIFAVEYTIPAGDGIPADAQTIHAGSTPIPSSGGVSAGSSMDPAGQAAAAPSSTIPAADKGKAPMVDDSLPADLLTEQERILKNLHDYQLGEDLAKKLYAEQEAEFARQQEELAQKAQAEGVASLAEQDWLELMPKIATNSALSKQLLGDDVDEENMIERLGMLFMRKQWELAERSWVKPMNKMQQQNFMRDFVKNQSASVYNQGWTMKQVNVLSIAQLKHEFEYIQRTLERTNLLNFKRTTFRPTPTLKAPSAKRARQGVPQDVHAASSQVLAGVSATQSTAVAVSVPAASSIAADVSVSAAPSVHADTEVHADESRLDDTQTASEHVSTEHTADESTPSCSRTRRKQLAKKMVTPIVDVADDALIKFDSASDSDDDPLPYAPFAGWELVPTPLGSIHAYYDMEEHTKHFTSLRELLHMVEKNDLRRLLGTVDNLYQMEEPDTFALIFYFEAYVVAWVGSPKDAGWRRFDHGRTVELASPEQTDTGKDVSNLFMAVMVCQKILGYFSSPMIYVPRAGLVINLPGYVVPAGRLRSHSCCWVSAGKHSFCCETVLMVWVLSVLINALLTIPKDSESSLKSNKQKFLIYHLELPDKLKAYKQSLVLSQRKSYAEAHAKSCTCVQSINPCQITMDIDFRWGGDPDIVLGIAAAEGSTSFTIVRVIFQLCNEIPCISVVVVASL
nr:hypothetical protein [Tanacetum cinerariifolium]